MVSAALELASLDEQEKGRVGMATATAPRSGPCCGGAGGPLLLPSRAEAASRGPGGGEAASAEIMSGEVMYATEQEAIRLFNISTSLQAQVGGW